MMRLPESGAVDVASLAGIFKDKTNSYKFLFFQALLQLIKKTSFERDAFSFKELEKEMVDIAKYPINAYRLSFGVLDQVAAKLKEESEIDLTRYVPYRLLTPFFTDELRNKRDAEKNNKIEELSKNLCKGGGHSIYKIEGYKIQLYPEWRQYLENHFALIEGWSFWHWVNYLQNKNPNAISLVNKLRKPIKRASLIYQKRYWGEILEHQPLRCIFSNKPIPKEDFALDHFLPWNFIGHNQLWNLIPVTPKANSAKSDNIPSMDEYLEAFIDKQIKGLMQSKQLLEGKEPRYLDDFIMGLNIDYSYLDNETKIRERYCETIRPLVNIAHNMGFNSEWVYK